MQTRSAWEWLRPVGVLAAVALVAQLAGCAGSPAKVPKCSGSAVPINAPTPIVEQSAEAGSVNGGR